MDTAEIGPAFHLYFKQRVVDVQDQVDSLSRPDLPAEERKGITENVLANLTKLSAALADTSSSLASYDQRSYNQTIKSLQDQLSVSQAVNAPKTKFSFKSKKLNQGLKAPALSKKPQRSHLLDILPSSTSDVESATTSRSTTPLHLQDPEDDSSRPGRSVPPMAPPSNHLSSLEDDQKLSRNAPNEPEVPTSLDQHTLRNNSYLVLKDFEQTTSGTSSDGHGMASEEIRASRASEGCVVSRISQSIVNLDQKWTNSSGNLSSAMFTDLTSVLLLAPAVEGPVHITNVRNSILILACRQFRMHHSHTVDIYMHCSSRPIIEDCTGVRFAPIPAPFLKDNLQQAKNMYDQVDDFKWLRAEASPNWQVLSTENHIRDDLWVDVLRNVEILESEGDATSAETASSVTAMLSEVGIEMPK